ncbi:DUF3110 domain-containing protein [Microcystis aeruginosa]|uniref:DUF3110 domain-containing protein n=1 Tax=Microcystis aeruginosa TaxID=1126 RepID=UPI0007766588|nr:DUF3110 domain-containing protein [Microcystis aeruginosa]KXS91949.1 hypothetical protein OA58_09100 [Microcystis aeruginosa NIES-88]BCU10860.1 hypothetical protein MAN88_14240 [Microcystis aeruginosa]
MNEQRTQAYVNLIEQLLTSADGEELNNILQANQELIDPEFLQVMENYATWLEEQGNNDAAAWFRYMAQQLGQFLNPQPQVYILLYNVGTDNEGIHTISSQEKQTILLFEASADATNFARQLREQNFPVPSVESILIEEIIAFCEEAGYDWEVVPEGANKIPPVESRESGNAHQEYLNFLMKALDKVHENPDPKYIYPFFEHNLDKLDEKLIIILDNWVKNQLASVETEQAVYIAGNIFTLINFSTLIQQFPLGNIATNLEIAITGYQVVLTGFNFDDFPEIWADTQDNLGSAYQNRIRGDIAENLELSIAAYTEALKVRSFDNFPKDWADTQNNLANTYTKRIRGDKAENLELAIAAYNEALKVRTFDNFPQDWATTQHNLALAYVKRIKGNKADNLELAITACNEALKVRSIDKIPLGWANTKNTLAAAYADRIKGDKAENLELAIKFYNEVLQVRTYDKSPRVWAGTQCDLASAYADRIRGDKKENFDKSINFIQEALRVYNRDAFPYEWALTQNHLGTVYGDRIRGERADNLEKAIASYNLSLEVYTPTAFPINCLRTGRNLGVPANLIEDWKTAIKGYNLAIEAVENIRLEALNPQRQQEILSDAMDVYHGIVQSYLNLNQPDRALEYVERSKTRYLVQLLTDRDIYPKGNIPQTIITELDRLRRAIIGEEQQLAIQEQTRNRGEILTLDQQRQPILNDYTHLNQLKQELNQLIDREITPIDPTFSLTQKVESIPLSEIQSLIDQDTAILEWYIAGDSIMAFIVTNEGLIPPNPPSKGLIPPNPPSKGLIPPNPPSKGLIPPNPPSKGGNSEVKGVKVWQSSAEDREKLINFIKNYRDAYENNKTAWINNLNDCLNQLSEILHIDELLELIPKSCSRLILIPHWFLHIIPLHCLPLKNGQFLYQRFTKGVGYVPSCQLLKLVKLSQRENFTRLFAIKNPTRKDLKPLLGANLEIERISQGFAAEKTIIIGELEASEQTLENRRQELQASHCLHFSCHGKFNNESPRDSALMLADPDGNLGELANLTLAEVFEKFDLRECRLVTFSACESGIIESKADSISDEYVGLPSGFLFAGSSSVVSTLWTVDPLATTLFMTKFYHDLKRISIQDQGSIAIVLNHTQTWLRTLNSKKLARIKDSQKFQQLLDRVFESKRDRRKFQDLLEAAVKRQPYPFANPYYWTAFIATGI